MYIIAAAMLVSMFVFIFFGAPVAYSLIIPCLLYLVFGANVPIAMIPQIMTGAVDSFGLLAIPLFILAGHIMNSAGVTDRIFRFALSIIGHIRGGLGHVNIMASLIFAGISGSYVADAAGLGVVEIGAMKKQGYDTDFSAAVTAASACVGPIFPPSIIFVLYGVMAEVSIGRLFIGGIIPAFVLVLLLMVWVYWIARKRNYPKNKRATLKEIAISFKESVLAILSPVIIIGGMMFGIFTPTEAAIVACVWAIFLGFIVYKELTVKKFFKVLMDVGVESATIMIIAATAAVVSWTLLLTRTPQTLVAVVTGITSNKVLVLLAVNVFLLIVGCFMETIASLVILAPILVPVLVQMGVDPVHFGVVFAVNLMIGVLSPPFGIGLFAIQKVAGISFVRITKAVLPFMIPLLIALLVITLIPELVLFLPNLMK